MFNSISNKKVYEQVIEQIQKNIMDGTFKKGDKLPSERELSEKVAFQACHWKATFVHTNSLKLLCNGLHHSLGVL